MLHINLTIHLFIHPYLIFLFFKSFSCSQMKCGLHCPPGNEMYRLNDIKLFHLASRDQPVYSRRLGQLIQLLCIVEHTSHASVDDASTKLLENDVSCIPSFEELNHFILTIQDRSGSHLAGILSYVSAYLVFIETKHNFS